MSFKTVLIFHSVFLTNPTVIFVRTEFRFNSSIHFDSYSNGCRIFIALLSTHNVILSTLNIIYSIQVQVRIFISYLVLFDLVFFPRFVSRWKPDYFARDAPFQWTNLNIFSVHNSVCLLILFIVFILFSRSFSVVFHYIWNSCDKLADSISASLIWKKKHLHFHHRI